jgi:hypothetical protein
VSRVATNSVASLSRDEATALQFGFVGLGFRSAYVIQSWVDALKETHIQEGIDRYPASDADRVQLALENLLNIVTHRVQELIPPQYEIVQGLWEDVVLSDQAGLVTSHELYVPIDPRTVVEIRQGSSSEFSCVQADQHRSPDLVETLNDLLVKSARRWVVARTEVQLSRYAPMLTKSAVAERIRSSEKVAVSPLPKGKQWWTLR